jgi:hypothetical protein
MPPTIPVISPAATGTPEAIAMPIHSGNATKNAAIDDGISNFNVEKKLEAGDSFEANTVRLQSFPVT